MPTKEPTPPPPPDSENMRISATKIGQNFDCENAFFGLTQFAAWWIDFKKSECEGIDARFEIKEPLSVEFVLRKGHYHCKLPYDLPGMLSCTHKITLDIQVAIWKLRGQESSPYVPNWGERPNSPPAPRKREG
jgi:hypothetical protein